MTPPPQQSNCVLWARLPQPAWTEEFRGPSKPTSGDSFPFSPTSSWDQIRFFRNGTSGNKFWHSFCPSEEKPRLSLSPIVQGINTSKKRKSFFLFSLSLSLSLFFSL